MVNLLCRDVVDRCSSGDRGDRSCVLELIASDVRTLDRCNACFGVDVLSFTGDGPVLGISQDAIDDQLGKRI
jgi:hypothetical protein